MLKRLVLASSNPGKLREIEALLAPLGIEILPQSSLGVGEAEEPHGTFIENALARSEERRVGKECSSRWSPTLEKKKTMIIADDYIAVHRTELERNRWRA